MSFLMEKNQSNDIHSTLKIIVQFKCSPMGKILIRTCSKWIIHLDIVKHVKDFF